MKKNPGVKNWMFPMPVLMIGTYDEDGTPNMMNAAWGGVTLEGQGRVKCRRIKMKEIMHHD